MSRKEFIKLMEDNILLLDKLFARLKKDRVEWSGYPRQLITVLVRLYMGGRAKLKDIAMREMTTAPNLCAAFRKLEHDGLVVRMIDEDDRRNTWYSCTGAGEELAVRAMGKFREGIGHLFGDLNREDENALTGALKTINKILIKMEINNA